MLHAEAGGQLGGGRRAHDDHAALGELEEGGYERAADAVAAVGDGDDLLAIAAGSGARREGGVAVALVVARGLGLRRAEALADALERCVSGRVAGAVVGREPRAEDAGGRRERASPGEGGDDAEHRAARCVVLSEAPEARVARCIREYFEYFKATTQKAVRATTRPPAPPAMGNKKNARKRAAKKRKEKKKARVDVDESVASAIVAHVPDVRDRLALGCVSHIWRDAASSPGCWQLAPFPLLIEPPLANKLTDDAFKQLMLYAGNALTCIKVIEAPSTFKFAGKRLPRTLLPNLRALTINYCEGVSIRFALLPFLQSAVASSSIDYIHLAGCDMEGMSMKDLTELKSYLRDPSDPTCFDLCRCDNPVCHEITNSDDSWKCMACDHIICDRCYDDDTEIECDECCAFACRLGDCPGDDFVAEHVRFCEDCENNYCDDCKTVFECVGNETKKGCYTTYCDGCSGLHKCDVCEGIWCDACVSEDHFVEHCGGSKKYQEDKLSHYRPAKYKTGCGKSMCKDCVRSARPYQYFDWCDCCDGTWCKDCTPHPYRCLGANFGMTTNKDCCRSSHCDLCSMYGCDGSPSRNYHWCKSCEGSWCEKCSSDEEFFICPFCEDSFCNKCIPGPGSACKECENKVRKGLLTYEEDYTDVYGHYDHMCW